MKNGIFTLKKWLFYHKFGVFGPKNAFFAANSAFFAIKTAQIGQKNHSNQSIKNMHSKNKDCVIFSFFWQNLVFLL
jgi:hypothetical protein